VPEAEFLKMKQALEEDLARRSAWTPQDLGIPGGAVRGDTADQVAADMRAVIEAHRQKLQADLEGAQAQHEAAVQQAATPREAAPEAPGAVETRPATEVPPEAAPRQPEAGAQPGGEPAPEAAPAARPVEPAADPVLEAQKRLEEAQRAHQAFNEGTEPETVGARIEQRLAELGRFGEQDRQAYAALVDQFYTTMASHFGVTPDELFSRYPLQIVTRPLTGTLGQGQSAAAFYSAAIRAVEQQKMNRASGRQWLKTLENTKGVTREELAWLGLPERLNHEKPVTKQELLDHMRSQQLNIERVKLGAEIDSDLTREIEQEFAGRGYEIFRDMDGQIEITGRAGAGR